MATTPTIYTYREVNVGRFSTVRHYQLEEVKNGEPQLSMMLNISKNRDFARSSPDYWVKQKKNGKWEKPCLTGLFKTEIPGFYRGDVTHKTHLVVFHFLGDVNKLTIYYFRNGYRLNIDGLLDAIIRYEQKKTA